MNNIASVAVLCAAVVLSGSAFQSTGQWPPRLQQVSDESPVLSPEASMKTIVMPPGYRLELVASEPMIQEPVVIDWDADGRLWVVEMPGYMEDMPATTERAPSGRVSILEDTNGDGRMDKKTVFLDKLVLPRALKVLDRGALIAEPPNLWLARDTNGDLVADTKVSVTDAYGQELANVEHNANSLTWALDNWMHTAEVDVYLRLKDGKFEVRKTLSRGQWGASQDDAGRIYRNTNSSALFVDIVPTPYYTRNPHLLRTRGSYETLDTGDLNTTWPLRPTPGVNRGYQDGVLRPDKTLSAFTAVAAPTVYRGDRLPAELHGNVFLVEPSGNLVSRIIVTDDGTMLRGRKAYDRAEFMASTDERFRPVNLSSAPDGTLYVVDMYHGIIQHKGYITEYLRDQILSRKLDQPQGHGRIYRVMHDSTKPDRRPALSKASAKELVDTLAHPNGWWRDTAQRLLVERGARDAVTQLKQRAEQAPDWRTRLHALWTLDGVDAIESSTVIRALDDSSRDVRSSAVRLAERWLKQKDHAVQQALIKRLDDKDWAVRRQLAATLGELPDDSPAKVDSLTKLLERHGDDAMTVDAAMSGLAGTEPVVLDRLLAAKEQSPSRSAVITVLAATIVRGRRDEPVHQVLQMAAAGDRPAWQRAALLAGAEAALINAPLPGAGRRGQGRGGAGDGADAANTAQGARGGPGGAPAFPTGTRANTGGRGRGTALAAIPVGREPSGLIALAKTGGEMGDRATTLLARLTWPGKPKTADAGDAAAPLTAAEQQRFEAGKTVYTTLCVACHQEDGQGREKVAPTLVGSAFAVGPAGAPIRILLNGKEGQVGLMPPLGTALTDTQIAGVLTYVRRSWGHQASAVDESTVAGVRKETAGRARPWTEKELAETK